METPSRRIQPRRTKYQFPPQNIGVKINESQQGNKQNMIPTQVKLSDKTLNTIKKSQNIFNSQLSQAREYLQKFGPKVESIYELQIYRSYLKGKRYQHVLKQIQQETHTAEQSIQKIKQQSKNSCRNIIEENQRLQQLKQKYQNILSKEQEEFSKLSSELNALANKNETLKDCIKKYLKMLGTKNEENTNKADKENHKLNYCNQVCISEPNSSNAPIEEVVNSSIYLTRHELNEKSNEQKDISVYDNQNKSKVLQANNYSNIIKNSKLLPKINLRDIKLKSQNSSMQVYQSAIKKIEELQFSIISSKKVKNVEYISKPINDQAFRKEKIKEKKNLAEQKLQIIKLFIIYLKGNESRENKTGIQNLCKVISYFQKQVKRKEEVLARVKELQQSK